jgi:hypothetical protein
MDVKSSKWPQTIPTLCILSLSKIFPNIDFWFENMCTIWQPLSELARGGEHFIGRVFFKNYSTAFLRFIRVRIRLVRQQGDQMSFRKNIAQPIILSKLLSRKKVAQIFFKKTDKSIQMIYQ